MLKYGVVHSFVYLSCMIFLLKFCSDFTHRLLEIKMASIIGKDLDS